MFKSTKHLIMVALATATIGLATPTINVFNDNTATVSARSIQANGPWEQGSNNLDMLQRVSNGNEIYYSIAPGTKYHTYANSAAAAWNALGVINLVQVPYGDSRSQITIQYKNEYSEDDPNSDTTEDAETDFNNLTQGDNVDYMNGVTITYYKDMTEDSRMNREVIAEHEFGHALGFDHDDRTLHNGSDYSDYVMTMNSENGDDDDVYSLGGIEQRTLAAHYGITPSHWLNTNC